MSIPPGLAHRVKLGNNARWNRAPSYGVISMLRSQHTNVVFGLVNVELDIACL